MHIVHAPIYNCTASLQRCLWSPIFEVVYVFHYLEINFIFSRWAISLEMLLFIQTSTLKYTSPRWWLRREKDQNFVLVIQPPIIGAILIFLPQDQNAMLCLWLLQYQKINCFSSLFFFLFIITTTTVINAVSKVMPFWSTARPIIEDDIVSTFLSKK